MTHCANRIPNRRQDICRIIAFSGLLVLLVASVHYIYKETIRVSSAVHEPHPVVTEHLAWSRVDREQADGRFALSINRKPPDHEILAPYRQWRGENLTKFSILEMLSYNNRATSP
ncbi:hypothetical protein Bpfe_001137 [Biomphalaria pfeifferi]|uniref:Uncharacterized protein n=1 Tax=Biomphalaria pfeifferi TaxID=112525 RepID=A0AAD8CDE0_BIOPF|nr:hypothetical protein Bpfe_001137 [Biomphalaria pfeifferi]